jgi:hypothetical protein
MAPTAVRARAGEQGPPRPERRLAMIRTVAYWVLVILISLALVVGLILLFESRDQSSLDSRAPAPAGLRA